MHPQRLLDIRKAKTQKPRTKDDNREVYRKASGDWYAEVAKNNCVPGSETDCTESYTTESYTTESYTTDNSEGDENDEDEESNAMPALVSCFSLILSLVL